MRRRDGEGEGATSHQSFMKTDRNILMRTRVNPEHFHITRLMSSCCLYSIFTHVFTLLATVTKHRTGSQDDHWVPPTGVQWMQCHIFIWLLRTPMYCSGHWLSAGCHMSHYTRAMSMQTAASKGRCIRLCSVDAAGRCSVLQCDRAHCQQMSSAIS